jgi:uncharacterized protein (TIGR03435 family)
MMSPERCLRRALYLLAISAAITPVPRAIAQVPPPPPVAGIDVPTYVPTLTFDVASIRENDAAADRSVHVAVKSPPHASQFEVSNFTVKSMIQMGYGFGTPIANGPDWLSDKYFSVQAKSDHATDERLAKLTDEQAGQEKRHMVQMLLVDRMGLKAHWEIRETPVYVLEIAKSGSKLQETKADSLDPDHPASGNTPGTDVKATGGRQGLQFVANGSSTKAIAAMLVSQLNMPVVDKTGLTGSYKFTLQFGREWSANDPEGWPDIFTAVQEQLGLKLESTKSAIPVLVIDHIAMPSAN